MNPTRARFGAYAGEPDDLSVDATAAYLGLTPADVHRLIEADELYTFGVGMHLHVPIWQFTNHATLPHVGEVVGTLAPLQLHPMTVAGFMTTPSDELDGMTPVQWLAEGGPIGPVQFAATALTAW